MSRGVGTARAKTVPDKEKQEGQTLQAYCGGKERPEPSLDSAPPRQRMGFFKCWLTAAQDCLCSS